MHSSAPDTRRLYWTAGLVMGAIWAWNQGEPLWEHAVKLLVLLFVVAPAAHFALQRRARRENATGPHLSFPRLVAAKVALVALALGAAWLLRPAMTHADLVIAAGLALTIIAFGPRLHPYLLTARPAR
jgi:ABC-type amino acid transport system permease subunit